MSCADQQRYVLEVAARRYEVSHGHGSLRQPHHRHHQGSKIQHVFVNFCWHVFDPVHNLLCASSDESLCGVPTPPHTVFCREGFSISVCVRISRRSRLTKPQRLAHRADCDAFLSTPCLPKLCTGTVQQDKGNITLGNSVISEKHSHPLSHSYLRCLCIFLVQLY